MNNNQKEIAMFGAGCFWKVEDQFQKTEGVIDTDVGFSGGTVENPTYKEVSSGKTGHVEVVRIEYDPAIVSYEKLLNVFWNKHNPTTLDRQGVDVGSQYNSAIFYYSEDQREKAEKSKKVLEESGKYKDPIVTVIIPEKPFYKAEEYHQDYIKKGGVCSS